MGSIRGIQNHNERLKESLTNPDIDYSKSHFNVDLTEKSDKSYYMRIKDRISELNLKKSIRKDAVVACGFVCTSDKSFFDSLTKEEQDRFFRDSNDFLGERYGKENIIASRVHYDEHTPHMHCYIIPVTKDGRLSAKDIFNRQEMRDLQENYFNYMQNKGFELERGQSSLETKRKHIDSEHFKIQTTLEKIEKTKDKLEANKSIYDERLKVLESVFKDVNLTSKNFKYISSLEPKSELLGGKFKLVGSEQQLNDLISLAKKGHLNFELEEINKDLKRQLNNSNYELSNIDRELKNVKQKLESNKESISDKLKFARITSDLKNENRNLIKQVDVLEKKLDFSLQLLDKMNIDKDYKEILRSFDNIDKSFDREH